MECVIQVLKILILASLLILTIHMTMYLIQVKEARIKKIDEIEKSVKFLNEYCGKAISDIKSKGEILTVKNAKIRDFFVRTNYVGRLTDKKVIQDFKDELDITFEEFKNYVLNYNTEKLIGYYDIYKKYEQKQMVLDTYKDKSKETK